MYPLRVLHSSLVTLHPVLSYTIGMDSSLIFSFKIFDKHKMTVPHYNQSLVTSFHIKSHSCDLQSQRLGINHSVII
jgi:hypothetical protein